MLMGGGQALLAAVCAAGFQHLLGTLEGRNSPADAIAFAPFIHVHQGSNSLCKPYLCTAAQSSEFRELHDCFLQVLELLTRSAAVPAVPAAHEDTTSMLCYDAELASSMLASSLYLSQATELVTRGAAVPASHADAIRRVAEADAIAACLGGVKLSVPGLQAAKAAAKKGRKAKGK